MKMNGWIDGWMHGLMDGKTSVSEILAIQPFTSSEHTHRTRRC